MYYFEEFESTDAMRLFTYEASFFFRSEGLNFIYEVIRLSSINGKYRVQFYTMVLFVFKV